jgi:hypothetical protein
MAGQITISTLRDDTGVLATQNGMTGIAKAWVNFVGSTAAINGSFNVSSVTRSSAGLYTVNYTTAMPNANYSPVVSTQQTGGNTNPNYLAIFTACATGSCSISINGATGGTTDPSFVYVVVLSS